MFVCMLIRKTPEKMARKSKHELTTLRRCCWLSQKSGSFLNVLCEVQAAAGGLTIGRCFH